MAPGCHDQGWFLDVAAESRVKACARFGKTPIKAPAMNWRLAVSLLPRRLDMKRILSFVIWVVINILPDWLAMLFLDFTLPDWVERARIAMRGSIKRGR